MAKICSLYGVLLISFLYIFMKYSIKILSKLMEILNNVPSQELHVVIFFFLDGVIQEVRFCVAYGFLKMSMI